MKFPDYGKCQIRSLYLARELKKQGFHIDILHGIYTPNTPRYTWDERWQNAPGNEFSHVWLSTKEKYYDYSCFQFGAIEPQYCAPDDNRYQVLGYMELNGKCIYTGNLILDLESPYTKDGVPVLRAIFI